MRSHEIPCDFDMTYYHDEIKKVKYGLLKKEVREASEDALFTETGMKLGYDAQDGNVPEGIEYSGYVTFMVYAEQIRLHENGKEFRF